MINPVVASVADATDVIVLWLLLINRCCRCFFGCFWIRAWALDLDKSGELSG